MTVARRPSLKRELRRSAVIGLPSLVFGSAASAGAIWLGLDYTGLVLLTLGILLLLIGGYLLFVAIAATVSVAEVAVRRRLRRRPRGKPKGDTQLTFQQSQEIPPAEPQEHKRSGDGPMIF